MLLQTVPDTSLFTHLGTTGVYIYADNYNIKDRSATIHAESEIKNESDGSQEVQFEVIITDLNNKPVKTFTGDKTLRSCR